MRKNPAYVSTQMQAKKNEHHYYKADWKEPAYRSGRPNRLIEAAKKRKD
ncbi:MAG: hypothetical protein H0S84_10105 [Bacteroidales bacterium]|nr:hypothetical protein [Bacteroidales bacterium]